MKEYKLCYNNTKLKWSNPEMTGLLDEQIARVEFKKPSFIAIDGLHSGGKTTFTGHIGQYIEGKFNGEFDYEKQVGKGMDKFLVSLDWCRKNGKKVCVYDEAEDFERKGANSRLNRLLNKVFAVARVNKIIIIIVLGIIKKLEYEPLEKGLIRCLINVYGREKTHSNIRVYDGANIFYLMFLMKKYKMVGKAPMGAYSKTFTLFHSKILPADYEDQTLWDRIDMADKDRIQDEAVMETKGLIDVKTICKESGYSLPSIRNILRKLKPDVVKQGMKHYYHRSILLRIAQHNTTSQKE